MPRECNTREYTVGFSAPHVHSYLRPLLLLPLLRGHTLRRPGMYSGDLRPEGRIDEPMPRKRILLRKQRRHDHGFERLATAAYCRERPVSYFKRTRHCSDLIFNFSFF